MIHKRKEPKLFTFEYLKNGIKRRTTVISDSLKEAKYYFEEIYTNQYKLI